MRNKYFYPIFKLKTKSWIRYWLLKKTEFKGKLSEILEGFSFNLQNTLRQKFVKFEIQGHSIQDGEPSPDNEVPILSSGDNGSITEKIANVDNTEEQTYSIYTQQPFRSIGDVRDCFVKKDGTWYERHYIKRLIFNGTESWVYDGTRFILVISDIFHYTDSSRHNSVLSNYYQAKTTGTTNIVFQYQTSILIYDTTFNSVQDFKADLVQKYANGTPVYIDYILAEPLDLPCTEEQIQQLENIPSTFAGQTNVFSEDEVKPFLKIQYWESDTNG